MKQPFCKDDPYSRVFSDLSAFAERSSCYIKIKTILLFFGFAFQESNLSKNNVHLGLLLHNPVHYKSKYSLQPLEMVDGAIGFKYTIVPRMVKRRSNTSDTATTLVQRTVENYV
jgi:hypothetical protein